jgi:acyl-CoA synthetase (AMP-forming)/AMP-acid ligase II
VTTVDKVKAAFKARFNWKDLREAQIPDTAAILFTSGSESFPKAVPISQKMLLANLSDIASTVKVSEGDRQISFLPPFHSFGLSMGLTMPLTLGMPTVYTPDPTAFQEVGKVIGNYQASLIAGTPTFLAGIARRVPKENLSSLRLAVAGAEALTPTVVDFIHKKAPELTILEGYGTTETAPVISVNTPTHNKLGTIGRVLPSYEYLIADPDTKKPVEAGKIGKLFVRGPSVFDGYIQHTGSAPFTEIEGKRYRDTGDLVSQDSEGFLTFRGRLSRFIKPGGEMVSLGAIESELEKSFPRSATAPSIAIDATANEEVVLFVTKPTELKEVNEKLSAAGFTNLSRVKKIIQVPEIKLLATGKTDYQSLKALLQTD